MGKRVSRSSRWRLLKGRSIRLNRNQIINVAQEMFNSGELTRGYLLIEVIRTDGRLTSNVITSDNLNERLNDLEASTEVVFENQLDSDAIFQLVSLPLSKKANVRYIKTGRSTKRRGGFFPYFNKTDVDMTKFGIFSKEDLETNTARKFNENCFILAMEQSKLFTNQEISFTKRMINTDSISTKTIKEIANTINFQLVVTRIDKHLKDKNKNKKFNTECKDRILNVGLFLNHYFIKDRIEDINYKKFFNPKIRGTYTGNGSITITRFLNVLFNQNSNDILKETFEKIKYTDVIHRSVNKTKIDMEISSLFYKDYSKYSDKSLTEIEDREINMSPFHLAAIKYSSKGMRKYEKNAPTLRLFFDFESDPTCNPHKPYMVVVINEKDKKYKSFSILEHGENFVDIFMSSLVAYATRKNVKFVEMYAHNLAYDFQFLARFGYNLGHLSCGSSLYSSKFKYHGITFRFYDTYKMISFPLHMFKSIFGLNIDKEILPYELYSGKYLSCDTMPLDIVKTYFDNKKQDENKKYIDFYNNVKKLDLLTKDGNSFYHYKYSEYYCQRDVFVMREGMNKFRQDIFKMTNDKLDIYDCLTISSVSKNFFLLKGVFDMSVYSMRGIPRQFIDLTKFGGRTMIANNQKIIVRNRKICDLDANGLYLSSMRLMGVHGGVLSGFPTPFEDEKTYEEIKDYDGYFVEIVVTSIEDYGKTLPFPLYCFISKGKNNWTNDIVGKTLYVNKFHLEDMIEMMGIKFRVIRGYYYDKGRCGKIKKITEDLHNERKIYKQKDNYNPIEKTYKVIGNGFYGKQIEKPHYTNTKLFNKKNDFQRSLELNYYRVKRNIISDENNYYEMELYNEYDKHFNNVHIGSEILALSKRIMNQVLNVCNENNIEVFYSDTDSMPMDFEKLPLLNKLFEERYGYPLLDSYGLGQFSNDFSHKKSNGEELYATESIYIAKKFYYNKVRFVEKENNQECFYNHIRAKGFPSEVVENFCKVENYTIDELYTLVAYGKRFTIDFIKYSDRPRFEVKNGKYHSKDTYPKDMISRDDLLIINGDKRIMIKGCKEYNGSDEEFEKTELYQHLLKIEEKIDIERSKR